MSERADPLDIDISGFEPATSVKPKIEQSAIRQVSEANNFPSRSPRRWRTGRNVQFNIKVKAETIAQFTAMADERGVPFGELLQHALDALKREQGRGDRSCQDG
jgi:hypothetical protein